MNIFNQRNSDDGYFPMVAWSCCSPHKTSHICPIYREIRQVGDFPLGKCKLISKSRGWNWVPSRNVKGIFQIISTNIQTSKSPGLSYVCLISLLGEHYTAVANHLASSLIWSQWARAPATVLGCIDVNHLSILRGFIFVSFFCLDPPNTHKKGIQACK